MRIIKKNLIKIVAMSLLLLLLLSLFACEDLDEIETPEISSSKFSIIFFDIENSSDGKIHYDGRENKGDIGSNSVFPADCYMIKCGNVEILVDAGFQLNQTPEDRIAKIYQDNVIKKIEKQCTDKVIEYLIVTHGDYDHIAGLAVDGGFLDYVANTDMKIETIIDFDSDLVEYLSNLEKNKITSPANKFYENIGTISKYRTKRDNLTKKEGTLHVPASLFFKGQSLEENTIVNAMPDNYLKVYFQDNGTAKTVNTVRLCNFYYFSDTDIIYKWDNGEKIECVKTPYTSIYKGRMLPLGELKNENDRYYYSISLGDNTELRILYNWYYDHFYYHSFDSQNRNNISVCFEVVSGKKKFLSFGDLGHGESGLVNYYKDTDILKNVTCFKASHHGSTNNGENSSQLFELIKPDIVVIPGLLQNPDYKPNNAVDINEKLIKNIQAGNKNAKIYCTQIVKKADSWGYISAPLCGDITVTMGSLTRTSTKVSYKGEVDSYLSPDLDHLKFQNVDGNKIKSLQNTKYWTSLYKGEETT